MSKTNFTTRISSKTFKKPPGELSTGSFIGPRKTVLSEESGSTLVETLVALAILLSVLLPACLFLGFVAGNPRNQDKMQAMGIAQSVMEKTLDRKDFINEEKTIRNKWIIRRNVITENRLVVIKVEVFRMYDRQLMASYYTERLYQKPAVEDAKD